MLDPDYRDDADAPEDPTSVGITDSAIVFRSLYWNMRGIKNRKRTDRLIAATAPRFEDYAEVNCSAVPKSEFSKQFRKLNTFYKKLYATDVDLLGNIVVGGIFGTEVDAPGSNVAPTAVDAFKCWNILSYDQQTDAIQTFETDPDNFLAFAAAGITSDEVLKITIYTPPRKRKTNRWDAAHVQRQFTEMLREWTKLLELSKRIIVQGDFNFNYSSFPSVCNHTNFSNDHYELYIVPLMEWITITANASFIPLKGPTCYSSATSPSTIDGIATRGFTHVKAERVLLKTDGNFVWLDDPDGDYDAEFIRHCWADHIALLGTFEYDTTATPGMNTGPHPDTDPAAEPARPPTPAIPTGTDASNFLGRYEDCQVHDDQINFFLKTRAGGAQNFATTITPASEKEAFPPSSGIRIAMKRKDDRHDAHTLRQALSEYAATRPPPRNSILAFERWVASAMCASRLVKKASGYKKEKKVVAGGDAGVGNDEAPPFPDGPVDNRDDVSEAHCAVLPFEDDDPGPDPAGRDDSAVAALGGSEDVDEDYREARESLAFWDWSVGSNCGTGQDDGLQLADDEKREIQKLFGNTAKIREKVCGSRKGEPLPPLHELFDGDTVYTGLANVIVAVMRSHIIKGDVLRTWFGEPADISPDLLTTIKEQLSAVAKTVPPLTVSLAQVRNFLADANPELRGPTGVRLKCYAACSDEVLLAYVDAVNHLLLRFQSVGARYSTGLIDDELKILLVELLGKGGKVTQLKKVRTICRGAPGIRIAAGVLGRELLQLAEAFCVWGVTGAGSRPNSALALSILRVIDVQLQATATRFYVQISEDICNYFNCIPLLYLLTTMRRAMPHPTLLQFCLSLNIGKKVIGRNGSSFAVVDKFSGGIQGCTFVMFAGIALQARVNHLVRLFILACYSPATRRLETARILRAGNALLRDLQKLHHDAKTWTPYSSADVAGHFANPGSPASVRFPHFNIFDTSGTTYLESILVQEGTSETALADLIAVVDDKAILILAHIDDKTNGNLGRLFEFLAKATELCFRHTGQFFSQSKYEMVTGSPYWSDEKCEKHLEAMRELAVKYLNPFGCCPSVSLSTKFLGFLFNAGQTSRAVLYNQIAHRLKYSRVSAELVYKHMRKMNGAQVRTLCIWAFLSCVLHLLAVAVRVFDDAAWTELLFSLSHAIGEFVGFTSDDLKYLLQANQVARDDLHKIIFSKKVMCMVDPRLMACRILRKGAAKWTAISRSVSVVPYATTSVFASSDPHRWSGFDAKQQTVLQDIADADAYLSELLKDVAPPVKSCVALGRHYPDPADADASLRAAEDVAAKIADRLPSRSLLVPLPVTSDPATSSLARNYPPPKSLPATCAPFRCPKGAFEFILDKECELVVLCEGRPTLRYTTTDHYEICCPKTRNAARYLALVCHAIHQILLCPDVQMGQPQLFIYDLSTNACRDLVNYRQLWLQLWCWPGVVKIFDGPPRGERKLDAPSTNVRNSRSTILELAARDVGVSWPIRDYPSVPIDFKTITDHLHAAHFRNRVHLAFKKTKPDAATSGGATGSQAAGSQDIASSTIPAGPGPPSAAADTGRNVQIESQTEAPADGASAAHGRAQPVASSIMPPPLPAEPLSQPMPPQARPQTGAPRSRNVKAPAKPAQKQTSASTSTTGAVMKSDVKNKTGSARAKKNKRVEPAPQPLA
ncbi:unnamed protein product [Amoebophrya sp. A120]|nr:unnamed protein product [Amoebophrya sp. A120]|eukprot:GSA120T00003284001.1